MAPWGVVSREDPNGQLPKGFVGGFRTNHKGKISEPEFLPCPKRC